MAYNVRISGAAVKALKKLSRDVSERIVDAIEDLKTIENPRSKGKALTGSLRGFWRYRVGDYRIICEIHDDELVVIVVTVGHRRDIYR